MSAEMLEIAMQLGLVLALCYVPYYTLRHTDESTAVKQFEAYRQGGIDELN